MFLKRFPTDISFGSIGGPEYTTDIIQTRSGYEQRLQKKQQPRRRYNVAYAIKSIKQLEEVRAFFMNVKGRLIPFLFQDPLDHHVERGPIGKGDGAQKSFDLIKVYGVDEETVLRKISYPVIETLRVHVNGEEVQSATFQEGALVFSEAPIQDAIITASFDFDILARFDADYLPERLDGHGYVSITDLPIVEVRA